MFFCRTSGYSFSWMSPEFLFSVVAVRLERALKDYLVHKRQGNSVSSTFVGYVQCIGVQARELNCCPGHI